MTNYIQHTGETVYSLPACEIKEVQTRDERTQYAVWRGGKFIAVFPSLEAAKHSLACFITYSKTAEKTEG
jgi:hypothetical protein